MSRGNGQGQTPDVERAGHRRVDVSDDDVRAARSAVVSAIERGAGRLELAELVHDWQEIVRTQDRQLEEQETSGT